MTREQHIKLLEEKMAKNLEIAKKKNADYAGERGAEDPFSNFRACEAFGVPTEKGILVRMSDKMSRIGSLLDQEAQVVEESVQDALADLANYALILSNYLDSKKPIPNTKFNGHPAAGIFRNDKVMINDINNCRDGHIGIVLDVIDCNEAVVDLRLGSKHDKQVFTFGQLRKL